MMYNVLNRLFFNILIVFFKIINCDDTGKLLMYNFTPPIHIIRFKITIRHYNYNYENRQKPPSLDEQQKSTIRPTPTTTSTASTSTIRPAERREFDRFDERIQSPSVISIKQEIKPETSIGVDNLVASYVDSTTFLHSPSNISSPIEIQNSVLVHNTLPSEECEDMTSSNRMMDPLNMNVSGMGMVNPNAVTRRANDELPCELSERFIFFCRLASSLFKCTMIFVDG